MRRETHDFDPRLAALYTLIGLQTGLEPFVSVAHAMGDLLERAVEELEKPGHEIATKCRWLVEKFGTVEVRPKTLRVSYSNEMVAVEWEHARPEVVFGVGYPDARLVVRDSVTGETLVAYHNQSGGPRIVGDRAREFLDRLNRLVVLEGLADL